MGLNFRQQKPRPRTVMRVPPPWGEDSLPGLVPRIKGKPEPLFSSPSRPRKRALFWLGMLGTAAAGAVYLSH